MVSVLVVLIYTNKKLKGQLTGVSVHYNDFLPSGDVFLPNEALKELTLFVIPLI